MRWNRMSTSGVIGPTPLLVRANGHREKRSEMPKTFVYLAIVTSIMLSACGSNNSDTDQVAVDSSTTSSSEATPPDNVELGEGVTRMWIKPDLVDCTGEMEQKCMQIAEAEDGDYLWFYDQIDGFEYVEGTSYVLDVRVDDNPNPPADGSSLVYTLVAVVEES